MTDLQPVDECKCHGDEQVTVNGVFWCQYHQCWKSRHWKKLCETKQQYRRAWNAGAGPGQVNPEGIHAANSIDDRLNRIDGSCKGCKGQGIDRSDLVPKIMAGTGVGSQLFRVFARLGLEHKPDCPCILLAEILNDLGPAGCRERRDQILTILRKNQKAYGWKDYARAGVKAICTGLMCRLNPVNPLSGLLDMAIAQAESDVTGQLNTSVVINCDTHGFGDCMTAAWIEEAERESNIDHIITVAVTTFDRPDSLRRCLESIRQVYPDFTVEVEDTHGNLSAARNRLAERIKTPYLFLVEDDMEMLPETSIQKLLDVIRSDDAIGGCAGHMLMNNRNCWAHDFQTCRGVVSMAPSDRPMQTTSTGVDYRRCDIISNWGIFRTDLWRQFPWDEELELAEHREWYWRVHFHVEMAYVPSVVINHYMDRPSHEYNISRRRVHDFMKLAEQKIGLKYGKVVPLGKPEQLNG